MASPISTVQGRIAAETELSYQVVYASDAEAPQVRFDAEATSRDALLRLSTAAAAPAPMVLGDETTPPEVQGVLSGADAPNELRDTISAALVQQDDAAIQVLVGLLRSADTAALQLLAHVIEQVLGPQNKQLAYGLLEQLRQVVELRVEKE